MSRAYGLNFPPSPQLFKDFFPKLWTFLTNAPKNSSSDLYLSRFSINRSKSHQNNSPKPKRSEIAGDAVVAVDGGLTGDSNCILSDSFVSNSNSIFNELIRLGFRKFLRAFRFCDPTMGCCSVISMCLLMTWGRFLGLSESRGNLRCASNEIAAKLTTKFLFLLRFLFLNQILF